MSNFTNFIDYITSVLSSLGVVGGFLLIILESIIPALPLGVFVALNILAFGHINGFLISYIATLCGCMTSFYLFKYIIKDRFRKLFKNKKILNDIDEISLKIRNIKFTTLTILIAFPITPAFLVNIAAGLSGINSRKFFFSLLFGKPVMLIFYGYICVSFIESFKDPINLVYLFLLLTASYLFSKIFERIVKIRND